MESAVLLIAFVIAIILGVITGGIARKKGYYSLLWGLFGFLLAIVALPLILIMPPQDGSESDVQPELMKQCPYCAEMIKRAAKVCRYCGKDQLRSPQCPNCGLVNFEKALECRMCQTELP